MNIIKGMLTFYLTGFTSNGEFTGYRESKMAWLDTLLDHFAHYPTHLFALLVIMALSKSTVLVSSVL